MSEEYTLEILNLGPRAGSPCIVLHMETLTVMLDCSLDVTSFLHFLPLPLTPSDPLLPPWKAPSLPNPKSTLELFRENECIGKIFVDSCLEARVPFLPILDPSSIDVVLISSYGNMMALPYLLEQKEFTGRVYATEPCASIGKLLMEELVGYLERLPKPEGKGWKEVRDAKLESLGIREEDIITWRPLYSSEAVHRTFKKIRTVRFNESLELFSAIKATPLSSGYCLGSCNWLLQDVYHRICYLGSTSILTTNLMPLDKKPLIGPDLLLLECLNKEPGVNPSHVLMELCGKLVQTLKQGGSVLLPSYSSGTIYDLLECVYNTLDHRALGHIPIYFISPVANASLAYANICGEWLCQTKQNKVFLPESPFLHAEYVKSGRLKHFPSIHGELGHVFQTPCVVFTGHPSLRCGDVVHFLSMWKNSAKNAIIFTEPDFDCQLALAPYQPIKLQTFYFPIDPRLVFPRDNALLDELAPQHFVTSKEYISDRSRGYEKHQISATCPASFYSPGSLIKIPTQTQFRRSKLTEDLAAQLFPTHIQQNINVGSLSGVLREKDGVSSLRSREFSQGPPIKSVQFCLAGEAQVDRFVEKVKERGFTDTQVTKKGNADCVVFAGHTARVEFGTRSTTVITHGEDHLRHTILNVLLDKMNVF